MKRILSFGEVLWDLLPDGARLGGAPLNFSVRAQALGNDVSLISSLGNDPLGAQALAEMSDLGLDTDFIAHNPDLPTGTVTVEFENDQPRYVIHENVAYDAIPLSDEVKNLTSSADCFYFGTLIQRSEISRQTLRELLSLAPKSCVRFVDLNLRKNCFSDETIRWSVENTDIVKLSEEEIAEVAGALGILSPQKPAQMAESICRNYPPNCCVITCGPEGATASSNRSGSIETAEAKTSTEVVVDTVGAGDSFSAGFVHGWLLGLSLENCLGLGNGMGALAVSRAGGTAPFTDNEIRALLSKFA